MSQFKPIDKLTGIEFEDFVKELLEKKYSLKSEKTKASGDYGVDLIGHLEGIKYAIQTKRSKKRVGLESV